VARSASRCAPRVLTALAAIATAGGLTACATTQQEAARLQLNSARIRASELPTRVTTAGTAVTVQRVAIVTGHGQTAFVVQVRNPGRRAVTDLPISVGVRAGHRAPIYVNVQSPLELSYFDAHLPVVAASSSVTWVYTTSRHLPAHARPFARVGGTPSPPAPGGSRLPAIQASPIPATAGPATTAVTHGTTKLAIALRNLSGVPQYQLQVYAFAQSRGRYVAAGSLTVPHLGTQSSTKLALGLLGDPGTARLEIEALPTIFQ
jgi:hypothetical protein